MAGLQAKERRVSWLIPGIAALGLHVFVLHLASAAPEVENTADPVASTVDLNFEVPLEPTRPDTAQATDEPGRSAPGTNSRFSSPRAPSGSQARVNSISAPTSSPVQEPRPATLADQTAKSEPVCASEPAAASNAGPETLGTGLAGSTGNGPARERSPHTYMGKHPAMGAALANKPRLLSRGDACQGLFSDSADGASRLTLVLAVNEDGKASATSVQASPVASGRGVERLARLCAQRLRFAPAHDADGKVVAASSIVSLNIQKRHSTPGRTPRQGTI